MVQRTWNLAQYLLDVMIKMIKRYDLWFSLFRVAFGHPDQSSLAVNLHPFELSDFPKQHASVEIDYNRYL
jgi:hypothetical protein